jgi:glycosidase
MPWTADDHGGFTVPGAEPWLPVDDPATRNVADQREDPGSMLHLCRDLIALRRAREDLRRGRYEPIEAPEGVWAWRRGEGTVVAVNHGDGPGSLSAGPAEVLIGTDPARAGERVGADLRLDPWEAVVLAT